MEKATLYMMCGLPGAGKSTATKKMAQDFMVVRPDDYLYEEDGTYNWTPERVAAAWGKAKGQAERHLKGGMHVLFDATFVSRRARKPYIDLAKSVGAHAVCVFLDTPLEVCMERNAARPPDRRVPEETMRRMHRSFERPTIEEGFEVII